MAIFNSYVSLPEGNDQIRRYGSTSPTAKPCFHEMWYPWPSRSLSRKQSKSPLLRDSFHTWTSKSCILSWSGLKSSERAKNRTIAEFALCQSHLEGPKIWRKMTQKRRETPTFWHQNCVIESITLSPKVIFRPAPENPQRSKIMWLKDCPGITFHQNFWRGAFFYAI